MNSQQAEKPMTDGECRDLAGKVVDWRKTLTPKERAFMDAVIQRAVSAAADLEGYGIGLNAGSVMPPAPRPSPASDANELEEFQLTFQKIQASFINGGVMMSDSWNVP